MIVPRRRIILVVAIMVVVMSMVRSVVGVLMSVA